MLIDFSKRRFRDDLLNVIRTSVLSHVQNELWELNDERMETPSFRARAIQECMDYLDDNLTIEFKD